jgi:hypothetical protein
MYSTQREMDEAMKKIMPVVKKERPELFRKIDGFLSTPIDQLYRAPSEAGFPNR